MSPTTPAYPVWAPRAASVSVVTGGTQHPLADIGHGWWALEREQTGIDGGIDSRADYGFLIDGADTPRPDPRSRRQPNGVHGLTRPFDASEFAWTDGDWGGRQLAGGVVYELHIGTFTPDGTLDSAIDRLDHLVDLGVDFVEVLPVNDFNGTHNWGYDGVLWYAVHEGYGGPAAYQRFVDACHSRGLAVIQDVVYNHLGPSGNYLPEFGPYLHEASANTWGSSVDLDEREVRRYILDNASMWLGDYHVDGLRLDAVHALVDDSPTHILKELAEETDTLSAHLGRPLSLIAESDLNDPVMFRPREALGHGLAGQWSDDFHHAVHVALTGETTGYYADFAHLDALDKVVTQGFFHNGTYSSFREKLHGRPIDTADTNGWRLVVANQNHDQIGNRAIGDRLSATLDDGQLAIAAVLTLTSPFTPMLFMGEEWGARTPWQFFTSHPEPELGRATAEGRIREFEKMGWDPSVVPDPQDPETFTRSKLDWAEPLSQRGAFLLGTYRALTALRRTLPDLTDPRMHRTVSDYSEAGDERWFVMQRGAVRVLVNFSAEPVTLEATGDLVFTSDDANVLRSGRVQLVGHSAAIVVTPASLYIPGRTD
ncbi:MAG: malto-oligosyltrehalose trehalohydrolase [Burkholderiaceae bacterium]|nr:malto-oligosyltrehalose trehalohydrolase [Microbacteriaceae bacterium]